MTDVPSPFAPFQPNPIGTETPAAKPPKAEKAARKPRKIHAMTAAAVALETPGPAKPERKTSAKKAGLKAHSPKFELQAILAVAATLNEDDFPLFEKLVIQFDEMGKAARERILAAIGKVFS